MQRTLITGGAGFIGAPVADELLRADHEVRVLDALIEQAHMRARCGAATSRARWTSSSPTSATNSRVRRALTGVDNMVHLAARIGAGQSMYEIAEYTAVNAAGTGVLLEALLDSSARRLVVASSMSVYGEGSYVGPSSEPAARYEPFGLDILEAALAGCALVLGDIPSLREVWHDAAVHVSDEDSLAVALGDLVAAPEQRADLGRRAQQRAAQYTPTRRATGYLDAYRQVAVAA